MPYLCVTMNMPLMLRTDIFRASVILPVILLLHCTKNKAGTNTILYDKPLSEIQSFINGKWDLRYEHGGIATMTIQLTNVSWEFSNGIRVTENYHGQIIADTVISWARATGLFINGDSTYLMQFPDEQGVPWVYVIDGIYNDTLVLHDNAVDGFFYHFTRSK